MIAVGETVVLAGGTTGPAGPTGATGATGAAGATGPAGPAPSGDAGDDVRLVSSGVAGATSPDIVCTFAELSTTYAPSAVLRGVVAYASDKLATYVCRRTAASTYAWRVIAYDRAMPGGATAQAWWKLEEAAGATTFANSGAGGAANLTATTSGAGASVLAGSGSGPWGQPCVHLLQSTSPGSAYLESASGVIEPASPITFTVWIRAQSAYAGAETAARFGKKYIAAYTPITNAVGLTVLSTAGSPSGVGGAVAVGGVVTFSTTVRGVIPGGWALLGVTYDGVTQTSYLNGRTTAAGTAQSGAIDYGTGAGRTWYFGSSPIASTDRLNGQISEIRVDGTAWTAAQMLEAYQRGVGTWDGGL